MKILINKNFPEVKITAPDISEITTQDGVTHYFVNGSSHCVLTVTSVDWKLVNEEEKHLTKEPFHHTYSLFSYGLDLVDKSKAVDILDGIRSLHPQENIITIDATMMAAMTIACAKIIFGTLYKELGYQKYNSHIRVLANDDVNMIIEMGIRESLKA